MAQDVISTLFGITPRNAAFDKYTEDRMIDVNKAGSQYADLGRANIERASAMMQNAGTGIGIGLGRLLGGQTPQMAEEQRVQGMLGGASLQDPEQLMMAAERFAQAGDIPRAQALAQQAQTIQTNQADLLKKKADVDKVQSEMEMKQVTYANRFSALKTKFPKISDEEARAIANDADLFNDTIKDKELSTSVVSVGGRKKLINSKTGDTIKDLGVDTTGRGSGSGTGASKGKAPAGYRWAADGESLEPIPGGPKDTESKASGDIQKNLRDTEQMRITAEEAMTLLDSGVPTGSGVGRAIDDAAAMIGRSTPGAEGAAKLNVLAGRLTSSVPRMQGPQSDADVKMYQKMAGQVGDANLPLATRRAALQTVLDLTLKYEDMYKRQLEEQSRRAPGDAGPPTRANAGTPAPRGTQPTISGWKN